MIYNHLQLSTISANLDAQKDTQVLRADTTECVPSLAPHRYTLVHLVRSDPIRIRLALYREGEKALKLST